MIITKKYAQALIREGKASSAGHTVDNGYIYEAITRHDIFRMDHVKIQRTTAKTAHDVYEFPKSIAED